LAWRFSSVSSEGNSEVHAFGLGVKLKRLLKRFFCDLRLVKRIFVFVVAPSKSFLKALD